MLYLTEENSKNFSQQFTKIFEYVNLIETIETQNVKNVRNTVDLVNVFRKDENNKEQMLSQDEALYCAPAKNNGYFLVKSIF
ncbi:Asp-tRNA(Asn)/Glu-tRNA(Gln) amidotransferase subunit GatC [Candidatus Gottesmanbacteria bacterium]|nr:Asp-tRNA(Asn)/Glu-tRNA(Gln) amidotransferase subunit GatC [Candidatus Gottesmanbacteria bacterium]